MLNLFGTEEKIEKKEENPIKIDMYESETCFEVLIDCPGLTLKDVKLSWKGQELKVKLVPGEETHDGWYELLKERLEYEEERVISFPEAIIKNTVSAELSKGLLVVNVKKRLDSDEDEENKIEITEREK